MYFMSQNKIRKYLKLVLFTGLILGINKNSFNKSTDIWDTGTGVAKKKKKERNLASKN